ncbi:MAG: peptide chain release factor 1 [Clostridiales bacterium]|nr:peptide chain release factor 1 [Clostridiales bacterium]
MFEKIEIFDKRYSELTQRLYEPSVASNPEEYQKIMKEIKSIEEIVLKYREYKKALQTESESLEMIEESTDSELKELAQAELDEAKQSIERLSEELKILLLPKDPNDERNVIIEIRGGAGGEESALFSAVLFRMYTMYAERRGYRTEIINANETELGGYKEISFMIEGEGAYSRFKYESGVHRVQRVPETESQGRVHTSTTTVAVHPEAEDVELEIDPNDLKIDTFRSSGAGGQHINKTSSAIRITHIPTGTVVECQDERSQYKNKDKALKVLKSRLLKEKQDKQASKIAADRKSQVGTGDRSERIRTYNYPQGRITDHRIGLTLYKLEDVLNGNLDEVIDALVTADRAEKLKESMENQA